MPGPIDFGSSWIEDNAQFAEGDPVEVDNQTYLQVSDLNNDGVVTPEEFGSDAAQAARDQASTSGFDRLAAPFRIAGDVVGDIGDFGGDLADLTSVYKYLLFALPFLVAAYALGQLFDIGIGGDPA